MIIVRLTGGLGNQMFQYALGRHLALKNDVELMVDTTYFENVPKNQRHFVKREYDLDILNIRAKVLNPKDADFLPCFSGKLMDKIKDRIKGHFNLYEKLNGYKVLSEKALFNFDEGALCSGGNFYLIGYWQNERYFKAIEKQIRDDFTFKNTFDEKVRHLAGEIAGSNSLCLNIRRGDFVDNPTHGFTGMDYIHEAVNLIRGRVGISKVYVFSDEIDWCEKNLHLDLPCFFVPHDLAGRKFSSYLYLMSQCHHFVIPNSTFGWWAAWLSGHSSKMVVAPKQWLSVPGLDASGIMPEGWIAI